MQLESRDFVDYTLWTILIICIVGIGYAAFTQDIFETSEESEPKNITIVYIKNDINLVGEKTKWLKM